MLRKQAPDRRLWAALAAPGIVWLLLCFVAPLYVVLAIVFGQVDPIFRTAVPVWNPLQWNASQFNYVLSRIFGANDVYGPALLRTVGYILVASILCLLIAFPVSYYVARLAGRRQGILLVLLIAPFWISYMMRMLAWVNLLQNDGLVNRLLSFGGLFDVRVHWLTGQPVVVILGLVYGYVPYMILPLYAGLDRLSQSMLEASRDLGANRVGSFVRVTLPLCRPTILAAVLLTCLPMLGDYFTNDLLSASPKTAMVGNLINDSVQAPGQTGQAGAFVMLVLVVTVLPMLYYVRVTLRGDEVEGSDAAGPVGWFRDPWRRPRVLAGITIAYLVWSLLPVLIAVMFSFNDGRSRAKWQGFSFRWYWGDQTRSVWHDASLHTALLQTLKLGRDRHPDRRTARGAVRDRHRPVAGPPAVRGQRADADLVRHPRGAARRRAAVRGDVAGAADRAGHLGPGGRAGDLSGGLPGGAGAGAAGHHRAAIRRGRNGSRCLADRRAAPGHASRC